MKHKTPDETSLAGFIPFEEFPLSEHFKEELLRLTKLAKSGEGYGNDEEDFFELLLDYERRTAFPTQRNSRG